VRRHYEKKQAEFVSQMRGCCDVLTIQKLAL
jgi:hypothetical protein